MLIKQRTNQTRQWRLARRARFHTRPEAVLAGDTPIAREIRAQYFIV